MDHYKQRAHRQKYKLAYGAEGADRGKNDLPESGKMSPKDQSYAAADTSTKTGKEVEGDKVAGQKSRKNAKRIKTEV